MTAAIDWATARGFGFSHVISIGDMIDVDFGDLLDYLTLDQLTDAILLYVESIVEAKKFMSAGRAAMEGRLRRGFSVKRLTDLPMLWSEQWRAIGLQEPIPAG